MEEGKEECHEKVVASLVDVPQEVCDLNPVKTCRFATKLVPHLSPTHQCTIVPREVCVLKYSTPRQVTKPLISKWCLDTSEDPTASQSSEESKAVGEGGEDGPVDPAGPVDPVDPADPNIRQGPLQGKAAFDRNVHAHVIENNHCHICQADV